jgi:hypothetical protein
MDMFEDIELSADFVRMLRHAGDLFLEANSERNVHHLDLIMINSTMLVTLAALKKLNPDRKRAERYIQDLMAHWDRLGLKEFP